jgi:hypothetical protein
MSLENAKVLLCCDILLDNLAVNAVLVVLHCQATLTWCMPPFPKMWLN